MSNNITPENGFALLPLSLPIQSAVKQAGFVTPTPIQDKAIPILSQGCDLIGQAKTGTGKTAAFALPLLSRIDLECRRPQVLVLTPTRELAIQVAKEFESLGRELNGLSVLPIYGGQSFGVQLNRLKKGVHIVVGTPGRLMDHIRKKTISLQDLFCKVLDEADEMLHMGFIEDVEWIFEHTPDNTQTALFSATMPGPIKKIAQKYLDTPETITIQSGNQGLETISQQFWLVKGCRKDHALVRFLDGIEFNGVIVFVRTRAATLSVCKVLEDKGFRAETLNGDMAQAAREKTIHRLKNNRIDILVATDVAARGLDVDRISHVINYDMPDKTEPYIHRIGRTGRAGRTGDALLFVHPKERWMIRKLEKATGQKIEQIMPPSNKTINKKRIKDFKAAITTALDAPDLEIFEKMATEYARDNNISLTAVAAALGKMVHGDTPFLLEKKGKQDHQDTKPPKKNKTQKGSTQSQPTQLPDVRPLKKGMERYRIEVGRRHGVKARDIVGAISNEAGLESKFISGVTIKKEFSLVDLPEGMPKDIFRHLKKTWVRSRPMEITKVA